MYSVRDVEVLDIGVSAYFKKCIDKLKSIR